jgi:hypothetical protein
MFKNLLLASLCLIHPIPLSSNENTNLPVHVQLQTTINQTLPNVNIVFDSAQAHVGAIDFNFDLNK